MIVNRCRLVVAALVLILGAVGYAAIPGGSTSRRPHAIDAASVGMTLGHVPRASAPTSATVVIGTDAAVNGYQTKVVTISRGGTLSVVNLDTIDHTVTAVAHNANGEPLFFDDAAPGSTSSIPAASKLAAGTYAFYCSFHPTMRGTLIVLGSPGGGTRPVATKFTQALKLPKVLTGSRLHITVRRAKVRVLPHGPKTWMWTYNGSYPGPTIVRPAGHDTKVTFTNDLPKSAGSITVHLHGDHHSAASDGQPDSDLIGHGKQRTYNYPLTDGGKPEPEAFDFYHDHRMNVTSRNNWYGLQGMFIVTDKREGTFHLPKGRYDVPLLVSDRSFTSHNQLTDPFKHRSMTMSGGRTGPSAPPDDETVGNQILVDGRVTPHLNVKTHRYRMQIVNASNFQSYDFALSDGRPLVQIGTGSDLLPKPVVRQDILLGPAQRADVIVDFHGEMNKDVVLESIARTTNAPSGIGTPTASIMQFRVRHKVTDGTRIPATLERPPSIKAPKKPSMTWTFALAGTAKSGTYWTVNGKPFNPHRVDVKVPLGSTQTWLLRNVSPVTHYIHLHEEEWHTLLRDGRRPPPWERGLEDTWRLDPGETVEVAAKFTDYTGVFMVHCHMLDHEDDGMMAQFAVVSKHSEALPRGYFEAATAVPPAHPAMAGMAMGMAAQTISDTHPVTSASHWPRRLSRAADAVVVECAVLVALLAARLGRRRYRTRRR